MVETQTTNPQIFSHKRAAIEPPPWVDLQQGQREWEPGDEAPARRLFVGNFVLSQGFLGFEPLHLEDFEEKERTKAWIYQR